MSVEFLTHATEVRSQGETRAVMTRQRTITTPRGTQTNAASTPAQRGRALAVLTNVGRDLGVIR
ncbi:MAG: hypothetical protein DI537_19645 [Stutzerimonas stutzeri]|nr:MAG: hypothetical protein DI537_19645 [Stutzerimonas stutzeri]